MMQKARGISPKKSFWKYGFRRGASRFGRGRGYGGVRGEEHGGGENKAKQGEWNFHGLEETHFVARVSDAMAAGANCSRVYGSGKRFRLGLIRLRQGRFFHSQQCRLSHGTSRARSIVFPSPPRLSAQPPAGNSVP